jgi:dTDP-4-amino-4,6-dideoxygalactose transaminase
MTTVDGGVLSLRRSERVAEARRLRWFGLTKGVPRTEVDITRAGYKYNMNNVAAVIGLQQLERIEGLIGRHTENGRFLDTALQGIPGLAPSRVLPGACPSYWLYTLLADDSTDVERRLADVEISAAKLHRPNHLHTVFEPYARPMPGLDDFYRRLVHLPCGWWVSDEERARMVEALRRG